MLVIPVSIVRADLGPDASKQEDSVCWQATESARTTAQGHLSCTACHISAPRSGCSLVTVDETGKPASLTRSAAARWPPPALVTAGRGASMGAERSRGAGTSRSGCGSRWSSSRSSAVSSAGSSGSGCCDLPVRPSRGPPARRFSRVTGLSPSPPQLLLLPLLLLLVAAPLAAGQPSGPQSASGTPGDSTATNATVDEGSTFATYEPEAVAPGAAQGAANAAITGVRHVLRHLWHYDPAAVMELASVRPADGTTQLLVRRASNRQQRR